MHFKQCKIFSSSSEVAGLEFMINEWLEKNRSTINVVETAQSECAYGPTPHLPSMHYRTITIWYEQKPSS